MIKTKAFHGCFFLTVRRGANRTAPYDFASKQNTPHRTVDFRIKRSAPHRTSKNKNAPHRTVSSNNVNRVKCNDLYDESYLELQNWCKARRLRNEVPGGYIAINTYMMPVYTGMISLTFGRKSRTISYLYGVATV